MDEPLRRAAPEAEVTQEEYVLSEGHGRVRGRPRTAALTALAAIGLAAAAVLAGGIGGSAESRIGALPNCGAEIPIPGGEGETVEIICGPSAPPINTDPPPDFEPDPGPLYPYVP